MGRTQTIRDARSSISLGIGCVRGNSNDCNAGCKDVDSVREKIYNYKYIR